MNRNNHDHHDIAESSNVDWSKLYPEMSFHSFMRKLANGDITFPTSTTSPAAVTGTTVRASECADKLFAKQKSNSNQCRSLPTVNSPLISDNGKIQILSNQIKQNLNSNLNEEKKNCNENDDEENIKGNVAEDIEGNIEENVKGNVKGDIEGNVEGNVEENVKRNVKENIERNVEGNVEENVKRNVKGNIERNIEENIDEYVEKNVKKNCTENCDDGRNDVMNIDEDIVMESALDLSTNKKRYSNDNENVQKDEKINQEQQHHIMQLRNRKRIRKILEKKTNLRDQRNDEQFRRKL